MKRNRWNHLVLAIIVLFAMAAPSLATILFLDVELAINGVDSNGMPASRYSGTGPGKIYKETITGIVVGYGYATVVNRSGVERVFMNQGLTITDPWTKKTFKTTNDVEIVSPPIARYSGAALVIAFNPAAVP